MSSARKPFRSFVSAALTLTLCAVASYVALGAGPAQANHGAGTLSVTSAPADTGNLLNASQNQPVTFTATLLEAPANPTLIMGELEGGPNDPTTDQPATTPTYATPEMFCTVTAPDVTCTMTYTFPVTDNTTRSIRFYVNNHQIDTQEGANSSPTLTGGTPGCQSEPDTTDVINYVVTSLTQPPPAGTAPAHGPVPAGVNVPFTCDAPEPSPSATPSSTGSTSPSTSLSPTGSTSPSASPSPSGSPTGSTSPSPSPTSTAGQAVLTLRVTPAIGVYGTDFLTEGDLTCNGVAVSGADITAAYRYTRAESPVFVGATTTDSAGHYQITASDLPASSEFDAVWQGNSTCPGNASPNNTVIVQVRPGVTMNPDRSAATFGTVINFAGEVLPAHPGQKVYLMLLHGDTGRYEPTVTAILDANSRYRVSYKKMTSGYLVFRVAYPTQDTDHAWNWSVPKRVSAAAAIPRTG